MSAAIVALGCTGNVGRAEVTDLANAPLADSASMTVLPNLMFILDDSGSMQWTYMPDNVIASGRQYHRKVGYRNHLCNKLYYNPAVNYDPPKNADGSDFPNASFTAAPFDGYVVGSPSVNLSTKFNAWRSTDSSSNPETPSGYNSDCWNTSDGQCSVGSSSSNVQNDAEPAYYYVYAGNKANKLGDGSADDHCKNGPSSSNWIKVVVSSTSGPGGTDERQNFANWYSYYRTRILAMKTAAGRAFDAVDDKYRVGFITINPKCNNGSSSSCTGNVKSDKYLEIDKFEITHKTDWYSKLYNIDPEGGTPLREALSRVGRHYAGKTDGINQGMSTDPLQYSCHQNFALLTTDGYWNGNSGQKLDGSGIGNQDNNSSATPRPFFDGNLSGASNTLADVAVYYYNTDLRPAGSTGSLGTDVSTDNVKITPKDNATHQHMTTFTLGLGLNGQMVYQSNYETATTGDYAKIKTGATGCSWQSPSAICNWPVPAADSATALDDLWHAAVNGRGTYFSAQDTTTLSNGLSNALASLSIDTGAAAASATSSPNITLEDNSIFSTTYRTTVWDGEIVAQKIDTTTGQVIPTVTWSARTNLNGLVSATTDSRTIHTFDAGSATKLKGFQWANLTAAEQAYFNNKCSALAQCASLDPADASTPATQATTNNGQNLLRYLRGQTQHEVTHYRDREYALGDMVNSTPVYVKKPRFNFTDAVTPNYGQFTSNNASRQAMLYVGANDGMLHAFNADTGAEAWAYVPTAVLPNLYKLADNDYRSQHQYFVDGSPVVMDVFLSGAWKTVLVAGLNAGGRSYFALDITDPANPKALWEFTVRNPSVTACAATAAAAIGSSDDCDLGYTFGNPIVTKRESDGKWVAIVTSGYNNVSPGDGKGYFYVLDMTDGKILDKIGTGVGSTTTPSGLVKISAYADNFVVDNTSPYVYGGDLLGNVWRLDLTAAAAASNIAQLKDSAGKPQPITTRPELGEIEGYRVIFVGTGRFLGVSDLSDPATLVPPLPYAYQQSFYGFKDSGIDNGNLRVNPNMKQQTLTQVSNTMRTVSSPIDVDWNSDTGWFIDFNPGNNSPGERVNIDPQLILGTLLVFTNVPETNACTGSGSSWFYQFDYLTGSYVSTSALGTVGQKIFSDALTVGNVVIQLPSGAIKTIITGDTGIKLTQGVNVGSGAIGTRRISWRELIK
jgi:type IV pilus assembly protein PilY1